jgi:hypothetical protein
VNDNVHSSSVSKLILLGCNASHAQFLPCLRGVCFLCDFDRCCVFLQLNQARSNFRVVLGDRVEDFCCFEQSGVVASVTNLLAISRIGIGKEAFKFLEFTQFRIGKGQCVIDVDILCGISNHKQILNEWLIFEILLFTLRFIFHQTNNSQIISMVLAFHKGFHGVIDITIVQVGFS